MVIIATFAKQQTVGIKKQQHCRCPTSAEEKKLFRYKLPADITALQDTHAYKIRAAGEPQVIEAGNESAYTTSIHVNMEAKLGG